MEKKKHYSVKLKERIAKLESDLYKILDGDIETKTKYLVSRQVQKDTEKIIWSGKSGKRNGIFNKLKQK